MKSRIDFSQVSPQSLRPLFAFQPVIEAAGLEAPLLDLVKMRASQMNGCAYCLDMHSKDARAAGETEQRLYLLDAWRETGAIYTDRERAALAWTEALTRVTEGVPDEVYAEVSSQFTEQELVGLSLAVVAINSWNRLNVGFRTVAGDYRPGMFKQFVKTA